MCASKTRFLRRHLYVASELYPLAVIRHASSPRPRTSSSVTAPALSAHPCAYHRYAGIAECASRTDLHCSTTRWASLEASHRLPADPIRSSPRSLRYSFTVSGSLTEDGYVPSSFE